MRTDMKYIDSLNGREFEKYVYKLFSTNPRYEAKLTPASYDFGTDVIIKDKHHPEYHKTVIFDKIFNNIANPSNKKSLGYYKRTYGIQCKHTNGVAIGYKAVEEAIGGIKYYKLPRAIVLTNGLFTQHAKAGAKRTGVVLLDRDSLRQLIHQHYIDILRHTTLLSNKKSPLKVDANLVLESRC